MSWNIENEDCVFAGEIDSHRTNPTCEFAAHNGNYCVQQDSIRPGFGVQCDPTGPIKEYCPDGSPCPPLKPGAKYSLCPGEDPAFCADTPNTKESCSGPIPGSPAGKYLWCKKDGPSPKPGPAPSPKPGPAPSPKPGPAPSPKPGPAPELCGVVESQYKHRKTDFYNTCMGQEKKHGCCKNDNLVERGLCIQERQLIDEELGNISNYCTTDYGYSQNNDDVCTKIGDHFCSNLVSGPWWSLDTRNCVPDYRSPLGFGCITGYSSILGSCYTRPPNNYVLDNGVGPFMVTFCKKDMNQLQKDNQHDLVDALNQTADCWGDTQLSYYVPYIHYGTTPPSTENSCPDHNGEDIYNSNRYKCNLIQWEDGNPDKPVTINSNNTYWNFRTQRCEPIKAQRVDEKGNTYWKPPLSAYSRYSQKP